MLALVCCQFIIDRTFFVRMSLLVKSLIRNSRFNKASDAFLLYFSIYLVLKLVLFVSRFDSVGY